MKDVELGIYNPRPDSPLRPFGALGHTRCHSCPVGKCTERRTPGLSVPRGTRVRSSSTYVPGWVWRAPIPGSRVRRTHEVRLRAPGRQMRRVRRQGIGTRPGPTQARGVPVCFLLCFFSPVDFALCWLVICIYQHNRSNKYLQLSIPMAVYHAAQRVLLHTKNFALSTKLCPPKINRSALWLPVLCAIEPLAMLRQHDLVSSSTPCSHQLPLW